MKLRAMTIRARVGVTPALVILLGGVLFARPVNAGSNQLVTFEDDLKTLPADAAETVRACVSRLKEHGVPTAPLEQKLREGLTKNIPPPQLTLVLSRMTDNSLWHNEQISPCVFAKNPDAKAMMLGVGSDVLLGALTRDQLLAATKVVCGVEDGASRVAQAFELYSYAVNRLRADKSAAWSFTLALLSQKASKAATNQLVQTLQEVFKTRGSIDNALGFATARLRSGAPLRSTANEIREQFL